MNDPTAPSQPPPNYGSAPGYQYPQPGVQATGAVGPSEPPPKYEVPKEGPYAQEQPQTGGYPQPSYAAGYQQGQHPGVAVHHNTIIVQSPGFTPIPKQMECPNCHAFITTAVNHQSGGLTWLSAGLLCLFGCWMGCCLIPFCIDDLQDVEHRCPNCGRHLGTYCRL